MVPLRERGFLPFTAVGFLIIILTVAVIGHYQWSSHHSELELINDSAASSTAFLIANVRNELELQARYSLNHALWRVGKNGKFKSTSEREKAIENMAGLYLLERLSRMELSQENTRPNRVFRLGGDALKLRLEPVKGGFPRLSIDFPKGTKISGALPDNSLIIHLPLQRLSTTGDARYYLLQKRMEEFKENLEKVADYWKSSHYALAYSQAWLEGRTM